MNFCLAPDAILDTHSHYYDVSTPERRAACPPRHWLDQAFVHPVLGDLSAFRAHRFGPIEHAAQGRLSEVTSTIHVQASRLNPDPVAETRWIADLEGTGMDVVGIIATADLTASNVGDMLDRHLEHPRVRGIRDLASTHKLSEPSVHRACRDLVSRGLLLELDGYWTEADTILDLARRHPDLRIIVEHCLTPPDPGTDRERWAAAVQVVSQAPNVALKLSPWVASPRPWGFFDAVEVLSRCIQSFGPQRCFYGGNWPFASLTCSFADTVRVLNEALQSLEPDERHDIRHRAAQRWYGVQQCPVDG